MKSIVLVLSAPFWGAAVFWLSLLCLMEARAPAKVIDLPSSSTSLWDARSASWRSGPALRVGRTRAAATLLSDGSVLIAGGEELARDAFELVPSRSSEVWSPDLPSTMAGALPADAVDAVAVALPGSRAILITASSPLVATARASQWVPGPPYVGPPGGPGSFAGVRQADGSILLVGSGYDEAAIADPPTFAWRRAPPSHSDGDSPALVALADGRTLLVARTGSGSEGTEFQVFSPRTASWERTATTWWGMAFADGDVLVAGGDGAGVSRVERSAIALALAGGLGVLLLVTGAILAVRAARPHLAVLVLAVLLASVAALALYAVFVPRGGG